LVKPARGVVFVDGEVVEKPGPDRAVIFQDHSLLPWLTVEENVRPRGRQDHGRQEPGRAQGVGAPQSRSRPHGHAANKRPGELSGGMKQRVGIARAIAMSPRVLLMDEPFGALDALTRASLQDAVMEIQAQLNNTVVMITHDVDEAILLADRVVMMTNGPAAAIGEDMKVDLVRPRDRIAVTEVSEYNRARHQVLEFLHQRFSNPLDKAA
jgi:nitrate/nitrite transport system ATP-binding protein